MLVRAREKEHESICFHINFIVLVFDVEETRGLKGFTETVTDFHENIFGFFGEKES